MTDQEKIAFAKGFEAAWDERVGTGDKAVNPYSFETDASLFNRWQDGYDSYAESLM